MDMRFFIGVMFAGLAWVVPIHGLCGQSEGTPIYEQAGTEQKQVDQKIIREILKLRKSEKLLSKKEIDRQMLDPQPQAIELLPSRTENMGPEDIAAWARMNNLRVGYCYRCLRCDEWHLELAGGYAVAEDVVVTCDHVVNTKKTMREEQLVVVDHDGNVAAAVAVLARSEAMDVAIVKVVGARFRPVSLNHNVRQGALSYCFSHPLRQQGYFSAGIVNRFYWNGQYRGEDRNSLEALRHLRVNFSNDWAPGSSGSPLFDQAGNVIGHVSTIAGLSQGKNKPALMTMHTGIPAQCVERLAGAMRDPAEIKRIASLDAGKPVKEEKEDEQPVKETP